MTTARPSSVPVLTDVLQMHLEESASTSPMVESALAPAQERMGRAQAQPSSTAAVPFVPYNSAPRNVSNSDASNTESGTSDTANAASNPSLGTTLAAVDESAIVARVLDDLQRQIDLALEHQLARTLEPAIQRLTEALAVEARDALGVTLRDLVQRAVKLELDRLRAADTVSGSLTL